MILEARMERTGAPPMVTVPSSTSQNRAAMRRIVDLPAPEGPTRAVTLPCGALKETPARTGRPAS